MTGAMTTVVVVVRGDIKPAGHANASFNAAITQKVLSALSSRPYGRRNWNNETERASAGRNVKRRLLA